MTAPDPPTAPAASLAQLPTSPSDLPDLPGYQVLRLLGQGGMGVVYEAHQPSLDRLVAIKMARAADLEDEDRLRFRREAESVARLDHPHIVKVFEVGESNGRPYFAMEHVAGGTLAQALRDGPLSAPVAARL